MSALRPSTTTLGPYQLIRALGHGNFGRVWLAKRTVSAQGQHVQRLCAVKERSVLDIEQDAIDFLREWSVGNIVQHPNVVQVTNLERVDERLCVEMEYIDGLTFEEIQLRLSERGCRIPMRPVVEMAIGVAAGLHAIHQARGSDGRYLGLVHRDIKPSNLMVDRHGVVKILDLGITRGEQVARVTEDNMVKGTRQYMAPEQHRDQPLCPGTDMFALGAVVFELIVGEALFAHDEAEILLRKKTDASTRVRLSAKAVELGPMEPILVRCLGPRPEDRFSTASELGTTLRELRLSLPQGPDLSDLMGALGGRPPRRAGLDREWTAIVDALSMPYFPRSRNNLVQPGASGAAAATVRPPVTTPSVVRPRGPDPWSSPRPRGEVPDQVPTPAPRRSPELQAPSRPPPSPANAETRAEIPPFLPVDPLPVAPSPPPSRPTEPRPGTTSWPRWVALLALALPLPVGVGVLARHLIEEPGPQASSADNQEGGTTAFGPTNEEVSKNAPASPPHAPPAEACFKDADGDGYGGLEQVKVGPEGCIGEGISQLSDDCDDTRAEVSPSAKEICDGLDNDCKDGPGAGEVDRDGDGFLACAEGKACDQDKSRHTGAKELPADGIDQDCDGKELCYRDEDMDGLGREFIRSTVLTCDAPRLARKGGDCDDADFSTRPGKPELAGDKKDNDCNGTVDDAIIIAGTDFSRVHFAMGPATRIARRGMSSIFQLHSSFQLSDPDGVCKSVAFHWRPVGAGGFQRVTLPLSSDGVYALTVDLNEREAIEYYARCCYSPTDCRSLVGSGGKNFQISPT